MPAEPGRRILCGVNFPANTGFAWNFIEGLYAAIARRAAAAGGRVWVAYPSIPAPPRTLEGSPAAAVLLQIVPRGWRDAWAIWRFVRRHQVDTVYLTDRPVRHWSYPLFRLAGVRRIVVHDHTSGQRDVPRGLRRAVKRAAHLLPGYEVDRVLTVSDYVAARQVDVGLMPREKVRRIWNGVQVPSPPPQRIAAREALGLPPDRILVACCCRATPEKGVQHLIAAMALLPETPVPPPLLAYVGDGPQRAALEALARDLGIAGRVMFVGYSNEVSAWLAASDVVAVPSVWQDALPLGVLEPMTLGRAVVATRVGGIPEMCRDGVEGLLVEPGDAAALARALARLVADPDLRDAMGARGRERAAVHFTPEAQLDAIASELRLVPAAAEPPAGAAR